MTSIEVIFKTTNKYKYRAYSAIIQEAIVELVHAIQALLI